MEDGEEVSSSFFLFPSKDNAFFSFLSLSLMKTIPICFLLSSFFFFLPSMWAEANDLSFDEHLFSPFFFFFPLG